MIEVSEIDIVVSLNKNEGKKMKNFKNFCDAQPKNIHGYVRYILEMSDDEKDQAVVALLKDHGQTALAIAHPSLSNEEKNECYSSLEIVIQDCIDSYNEGVDLDKELAEQTPVDDDEYLPFDIYGAWDDSGHGRRDFC